MGFAGGSNGKEFTCESVSGKSLCETWVQSLGCEDPPEEGMAAHCTNLAWRIPWTEEPGGLRYTGS